MQLTADLSNATAKISSFQLEVSALQQKENQLKVQLAAALSQAQERLSELENLQSDHRGNYNTLLQKIRGTNF